MAKQRPISIVASNDGLYTSVVGPWATQKYRVVSYYDEIFSTGMKDSWPALAYIDLFSGPGHARIRGTGEVVRGSPMLALQVTNPFSRYVFCDKDARCLEALRQRTTRDFPLADAEFVPGDCNDNVDDIVRRLPDEKVVGKYLSFCFVDPFSVSLKFSTLARLERKCDRIDFLVLLALGMDARRNEGIYTNPKNTTVDDLLDDPEWRVKWDAARVSGVKFSRFIAEQFHRKMFTLGYLPAPGLQMREFVGGKRLPLYHLAFYSKHRLGYKYWAQVLRYGMDQTQFDLPL